MSLNISNYNQVLYVATTGVDNISTNDGSKDLPFATIDFAKTKVTSTNALIIIGEGEFTISSISELSLSSYEMSYCGKGINTLIKLSKCGGAFSNALNIFNCIIKPIDTFGGDTRMLNYSGDSKNVHYYNVVFRNSDNLNYPSMSFFAHAGSGWIEANKYYHNCSFVASTGAKVYEAVGVSYGHYIGCASNLSRWFEGTWDENSNLDESKAQLSTSVKNATFDMTTYKLTSDDNVLYGVYAGDYSWSSYKFIIKMNDKYYSFNQSKYVDGAYVELTDDEVTNSFDDLSCKLSDLFTSITVGEETFKPIDKFDNFKLVTNSEIANININAIKSKTELLVPKSSSVVSIADNIDNFDITNTVSENASVKLAFSADNGVTWKTYNSTDGFKDLDITIPLKDYSSLTTEELSQWNAAKSTILSEGINSTELSSIDFNSLELNNIRFAYAISVSSIEDTCELTKLQYQYDEKGSMQLMNGDDAIITKFMNMIKVLPSSAISKMELHVFDGNNTYTREQMDEKLQNVAINMEEVTMQEAIDLISTLK